MKEDSLKQVLEKLLELQKLDIRQMQIESLKGGLPNLVKQLNQEMERTEQSFAEQSEKLHMYEKERGILEMDIKAMEGKQKIYQTQLYQVKNNREYDAVTNEIEAVKTDIVKKENHLLELLDTIENTKKSVTMFKEESDKLKSQFGIKKTELENRLEKTKAEEEALRHERQKLVSQLNPKTVSSYERIRNAKGGFGVVQVVNNACGGCHKMLPPQRLLEIREMNRITVCETCGRMIVWVEKAPETDS
jgi:predicted  nucleic acid-binding Zn-ribbon protein